MSDLVQRLRADIETWEGHYSDEMFVRYFPPPPLQLEAADRIEALERQLLANNPLIDEAVAQLEADEALMRQALEAMTASNDLLGTMYLKMDVITALRERLEGIK